MPREFKKLLHRLNRKDYQDALHTISKGIGDLGDLTRQSVELEPKRRKRSRAKAVNLLRELSASFHRALCSSILCRDSHHVTLQLTPQLMDIGHEDEDDKILHHTHFTVAMSFDVRNNSATTRFWDEVNIKAAPIHIPASPSAPSPTTPITGKTKRKKFVSFAVKEAWKSISTFTSAPSSSKTSTQAVVTTLTHSLTKPPCGVLVQNAAVSLDLCTALKKAREVRHPCYGQLIDTEDTKRQFKIYPVEPNAPDSGTWSTISLCHVLAGGKGAHPLTGLETKVRLALAIASSVLQLSKTPWLPDTLTSQNVYFFNRGGIFSYDHPFLLQSFPEPAASPSPPTSTAGAGTCCPQLNRNTTLFALGILLLEIILGSTLDQLRDPHESSLLVFGDKDKFPTFRDSMTAYRLLEERVSLISPAYKTVIERCIGCTATDDLNDGRFRQKVYDSVVMELEEILGHTRL